MKMMFLDESGDHNLVTIDPNYPVFVLGGIIADKSYVENEMEEKVRRFKRDFFGSESIVLHTADITRNRNGFECLMNTDKRERFYLEIGNLIHSLNFKVVACAIKKDAHLARYGFYAVDPYMLSIDVLCERFCFEIGRNGQGEIFAEKRTPDLDKQLDLAFSNLKVTGTRYIKAKQMTERITGISLQGKSENVIGLQLADLVVTPIGRYVIGKKPKPDLSIIERKYRCSPNGDFKGYGLVVLP